MNEPQIKMLDPFLQYGIVGLLVVVFAAIIIYQYKEKRKILAEIKAERDALRLWKDKFYDDQFKANQSVLQNYTQSFNENRILMGQINDILKEILKNGLHK